MGQLRSDTCQYFTFLAEINITSMCMGRISLPICHGSNYGKVTGVYRAGLQFTYTLSPTGTVLNAISTLQIYSDKSLHKPYYKARPWSMPLCVLFKLALALYCKVRLRNRNLPIRYKCLCFLRSWVGKQERGPLEVNVYCLWLADLPGFTRSVVKRDHALITPESHVFGPLPDWYV